MPVGHKYTYIETPITGCKQFHSIAAGACGQ